MPCICMCIFFPWTHGKQKNYRVNLMIKEKKVTRKFQYFSPKAILKEMKKCKEDIIIIQFINQ